MVTRPSSDGFLSARRQFRSPPGLGYEARMIRSALAASSLLLVAACSSPPPPRPPPPPRHEAPPRRPIDPDAGPQPMPVEEFRHFIGAVDRSDGGDAGKIAMIKTAAQDNYFLVGEVGMLIDHVTYRQSKLDLVPILNPRITDRGEAYRILEHFTYREDKALVEQQLQNH
jgi:hypothetical protein